MVLLTWRGAGLRVTVPAIALLVMGSCVGDTTRPDSQEKPSITTATLANGAVGVAYADQLTATGGRIPYAWDVSTGMLPAGLAPLQILFASLDDAVLDADYATQRSGSRSNPTGVRAPPITGSGSIQPPTSGSSSPHCLLGSPRPSSTTRSNFPQNPHLASEIAAKIEMLSAPGLKASILDQALFEENEVTTLDGRSNPVLIVFPAFAPENDGAWALMDIYQLIGPAAMGRAYARIHTMGAPYGVPLSEAARQSFIDEATEMVRDQVADLTPRI